MHCPIIKSLVMSLINRIPALMRRDGAGLYLNHSPRPKVLYLAVMGEEVILLGTIHLNLAAHVHETVY